MAGAREHELRYARPLLCADVAEAFYGILRAERELATTEASLRLAEERLEELVQRHRVGISRRSEVLALEAEVASIEAQRERLRGLHAVSWEVLLFLTGLEARPALRDALPDPDGAPPLEGCVARAMRSREDLRAMERHEAAAEEAVGVARAGILPTALLESNYYTHREGISADIDWDVVLSFEVPIFEGFGTRARVREARADRRAAALAPAACARREQPRPGGQHLRRPRVSVTGAVLREVEITVEAVGSLEAAEEISIPARVSGPVDAVHFKEGDAVDEKTVLATILDVSTLRVRFTVPELEASRLRIGQEARFSVRGAPGAGFRARLFYMSQKADAVTRSVECLAEVLDRSPGLRAGYFAAVRAVTEKRRSLLVPERAALPSEKGFRVLVLDGGRVRGAVVKLGLRTGDLVEVIEGLSEGDRVVTDGGAGLREGMEVEVAEGGGA